MSNSDNFGKEGDEEKKTILEEEKIKIKDIAKFASERPILFAIQKLRNGPIKRKTLEKFLRARFPQMNLNAKELIDTLIEKGFVIDFFIEKDESNGSSTSSESKNRVKSSNLDRSSVPLQPSKTEKDHYLCLIKDYLAIRKPPIQIYDLIEQGALPSNTKKAYEQILQEFFKKYSKRNNIGDDPDILNIFINEEMTRIVEYLALNIFPLNNPPKDLIMAVSGKEKFLEYIKKLAQNNIVYLAENPKEPNNPWIILLTDIELQQIFPEYLINGVAEQLKKEIIDKDIAIRALNILKNSYVKSEKPKLYNKTMEHIEREIKDYESALEGKNNKFALKSIMSIVSLYNSLGDYVKVKEWEGKLEEIKI